MIINGVAITCTNADIPKEELAEYVKRGKAKYGHSLHEMTVTLYDNDEVGLDYRYHDIQFKRLRRITGYLVGSLDRWNDGKRAEERDRVKHGVIV